MHNTNHHYHPSRLLNQSEKSVSVVLDTATDVVDTYMTNLVSFPVSVYEPVSNEFVEITDVEHEGRKKFPTTNFVDIDGFRLTYVKPADIGLTYNSTASLVDAMKQYVKQSEQAFFDAPVENPTTRLTCPIYTKEDLEAQCEPPTPPTGDSIPYTPYNERTNPCGWYKCSYEFTRSVLIKTEIICDGNTIYKNSDYTKDGSFDGDVTIPGYTPDPIYLGEQDPTNPNINRLDGPINIGTKDHFWEDQCVETYTDSITGEECKIIRTYKVYCKYICAIYFSNHCGCPYIPCLIPDQGRYYYGIPVQEEQPLKLKEIQLVQSTYPPNPESYITDYSIPFLPEQSSTPQQEDTNGI